MGEPGGPSSRGDGAASPGAPCPFPSPPPAPRWPWLSSLVSFTPSPTTATLGALGSPLGALWGRDSVGLVVSGAGLRSQRGEPPGEAAQAEPDLFQQAGANGAALCHRDTPAIGPGCSLQGRKCPKGQREWPGPLPTGTASGRTWAFLARGAQAPRVFPPADAHSSQGRQRAAQRATDWLLHNEETSPSMA